jgi:hypothetical protein
MGLDVYLEHFERPVDEVLAVEKEGEEKSEELWTSGIKKLGKAEYSDLTKAQSDEIHAQVVKLFQSLGLSEHGEMLGGRERVSLDSSNHPDHMFKVGYFRSSYNEGGINHLLRSALDGHDLYWIFEPPQNGDYVKPNWRKARARANKVLGELRKYAREESWSVHTAQLHFDSPNMPRNEKEALDLFRSEIERHEKTDASFRSYSCLAGEFRLDGEPTFALIPGRGFFGPCVYAVTKAEDLEWYTKALEIVIETCDYVLSQKDKDQYRLYWSG